MADGFIARLSNDTGIDPRVVAYYSPDSALAEQYRNIRTYIAALNGGEILRSMLVTSASMQEGKTITALNLAVTMAEEKEKKVVLVNADLHSPKIEKYLNVNAEQGLSDYLQKKLPLDAVLLQTAAANLMVLPSGAPGNNPAELLASQAMKELISELEKRFEYILFDTPAVIPFADAGILASQVDGVLLAVQAGRTRREVVWRVQEQLIRVKAKLLGVVLTQVEHFIPEYIHKHL